MPLLPSLLLGTLLVAGLIPPAFAQPAPSALDRPLTSVFVRPVPSAFVRPVPLAFVRPVSSGLGRLVPSAFARSAPSVVVSLVPSVPDRLAPSAFVWPVSSPRVVRIFDPPPEPWLSGHRGVDLAAPPGSPVMSAGPGAVVFAGRVAGRGVVSVDHASGLRTTYEPVEPAVQAGDALLAGQTLGTLSAGHPGCPAAACLHWGLRRGDTYLDPLALLGRGRVRLLPLQRVQ